ncbi:MAG: 4-hydroxythreonine-4-phosphate dehydrogenase PdxA [Planctomycetaceae bacterium]|jgi:4-hydroxythreonine-4-phosphate dehydrogenase|nr:4-hydroxythreonine-4-phosphate dehydrogenase PdxA [Planctomycetaceae bacterium]
MKPIAVTMGDAAGIGPEIIVKAWSEIQHLTGNNAVVYGHSGVMNKAAALCGLPADIPCIQCGDAALLDVPPGTVDARSGEAAYLAVIRAVDDTLAGKTSAVVTAPLNKAALNLAGHHYPGHTEILAERCGVSDFAMMLYLPASQVPGKNNEGLAVVHVTLHCAMRTIFDQITVENVLAKAKLADNFMRRMISDKNRRPHIGVCSLNPHAGEDGLFGSEEAAVIRPAVDKARAEGLLIDYPKPADTIMIDARGGKYDAVVAMFHDQGHIALKLLGMYSAVNVTLGLPIIRTSVAHGTAFDKAWSGTAQAGSLIEAVKVAVRLASDGNVPKPHKDTE